MDVMNYFKNFNYKDLGAYRPIAFIALVVGGLNLGLMGILGVSLIGTIFGALLGRLLYLVVGVAAGYECYMFYMENFAKKPPTA